MVRLASLCPLDEEVDVALGHLPFRTVQADVEGRQDDAAEMAEAELLATRISERAIRLGGTVTGEHGVGLGKRKFMEAEHGAAWAVMGDIKRTLDPRGILNPGKVVPGDLNH